MEIVIFEGKTQVFKARKFKEFVQETQLMQNIQY